MCSLPSPPLTLELAGCLMPRRRFPGRFLFILVIFTRQLAVLCSPETAEALRRNAAVTTLEKSVRRGLTQAAVFKPTGRGAALASASARK